MSDEQRSPHDGANYRLDKAVVSERDGVLRADDYDDVYFAARDGLAESHHVFIDGTNFAETLHRHKHLTIAGNRLWQRPEFSGSPRCPAKISRLPARLPDRLYFF